MMLIMSIQILSLDTIYCAQFDNSGQAPQYGTFLTTHPHPLPVPVAQMIPTANAHPIATISSYNQQQICSSQLLVYGLGVIAFTTFITVGLLYSDVDVYTGFRSAVQSASNSSTLTNPPFLR